MLEGKVCQTKVGMMFLLAEHFVANVPSLKSAHWASSRGIVHRYTLYLVQKLVRETWASSVSLVRAGKGRKKARNYLLTYFPLELKELQI